MTKQHRPVRLVGAMEIQFNDKVTTFQNQQFITQCSIAVRGDKVITNQDIRDERGKIIE